MHYLKNSVTVREIRPPFFSLILTMLTPYSYVTVNSSMISISLRYFQMPKKLSGVTDTAKSSSVSVVIDIAESLSPRKF